jgi:hypothetical protein
MPKSTLLYNICQSRKPSGQGNPRMGCVKSLASVTLQKLNELICEKHTTKYLQTCSKCTAVLIHACNPIAENRAATTIGTPPWLTTAWLSGRLNRSLAQVRHFSRVVTLGQNQIMTEKLEKLRKTQQTILQNADLEHSSARFASRQQLF